LFVRRPAVAKAIRQKIVSSTTVPLSANLRPAAGSDSIWALVDPIMSLIPGSAPFRKLKVSDLPPSWRIEPSAEMIAHVARIYGVEASRVSSRVVVELPDVRGAWGYRQWLAAQESAEDDLGITITSRADFAGRATQEERDRAAEEVVESLLVAGHPGASFNRVFLVDGN